MLGHAHLTMTRLACELGIPRATRAAYQLGTRRMPSATRGKLAAALAYRADELRALAAALRPSVEIVTADG